MWSKWWYSSESVYTNQWSTACLQTFIGCPVHAISKLSCMHWYQFLCPTVPHILNSEGTCPPPCPMVAPPQGFTIDLAHNFDVNKYATYLTNSNKGWRHYSYSYLINSSENATEKNSPIRYWRSTPTYCQLQSHVTQKLEQKSKILPW